MPPSISSSYAVSNAAFARCASSSVAEQGAEDADLRLPHGVEHVLARLVALGPGLGQPGRAGGRLERADHQAVVGDGGAGHVNDRQLNIAVRQGLPSLKAD